MTQFIVRSDDHSNHNLPIGAVVERAPNPEWDAGSEGPGDADWYTQGGDGDEVAIDPRDLEEVSA